MKILFSAENFYPRLGGAEVSMDSLLSELAVKNEVYAIYIGSSKASKVKLIPMSSSFVLKNIPYLNRSVMRVYYANLRWKKHLDEIVKKIRPDIIFTQLEYTPSSVFIGKKHGIKTVVFLNNYDHFCPFSFRFGQDPLTCKRNCLKCSPLSYKIQYPFVKRYLRMQEAALRKADIIVSASGYIASILKKFYSLDSIVYNQILDLDDFAVKKIERKYITFINPIDIKGASVVYKLARKMNHEFLVIGRKDKKWLENTKWVEKFIELPNVNYVDSVKDMKDYYAKTKILLIPSLWPEVLGRIALEAEINGIPCIGSNNGGVPEAIGPGGLIVKNVFDMNEWVSKINCLEKNYEAFSKKARKHAGQFSKEKQMKILMDIINS